MQTGCAFVQRLHELGWIEGRNVAIEYRWGEGAASAFAEIGGRFRSARRSIVIVAREPPPRCAKRATSTIPIVFSARGDPVGHGLVASLARPGGNVTGLSPSVGDLAASDWSCCAKSFRLSRACGSDGQCGNPAARVLEMRDGGGGGP